MLRKTCVGAECKEFKATDDEGKVLVAFATFGVVDADQDITLPGSFGVQKSRVQGAHNWNGVALGVADIFETATQAQAWLTYNLLIPEAADRFQSVKFSTAHGLPIRWSYGYDVVAQDAAVAREHGARRALKKLVVHEVSDVVVPAGVGTGVLSVKSCGGCGGTEGACACHGNSIANGNGNSGDDDKDWRARDRKLQLALAGVTDPLKRYKIREAHKDLVRPAMTEQEAAAAIERMHWQFIGAEVRESLRLAEARLNGHTRRSC